MSELPRSNRHIPWSERRDGGTLEFFEPGWRNGSRSAPKKRGPKGRVGSSPTPGTRARTSYRRTGTNGWTCRDRSAASPFHVSCREQRDATFGDAVRRNGDSARLRVGDSPPPTTPAMPGS